MPSEYCITLVLEPKPDPLARRGYPERDPVYRLRLALKRLLREYGLKAIVVLSPNSDELNALNEKPQP